MFGGLLTFIKHVFLFALWPLTLAGNYCCCLCPTEISHNGDWSIVFMLWSQRRMNDIIFCLSATCGIVFCTVMKTIVFKVNDALVSDRVGLLKLTEQKIQGPFPHTVIKRRHWTNEATICWSVKFFHDIRGSLGGAEMGRITQEGNSRLEMDLLNCEEFRRGCTK